MSRRTLTPHQAAKRDARKAQFAGIIDQVAKMSEDERKALARRINVTNVDGHALSQRNQLLIALQIGCNATIVGGFRQWLKQGRCVKKGEHGATILFPRTFGDKNGPQNATAAAEVASQAESKNGKKSPIRFLSGTVFDISQTAEIDGQTANDIAQNMPNGTLFVPPPAPSLMNRPPPGGWTEADKVPRHMRKQSTPQVPAMAGMSILGMLPAPEKNPEKTIWNSNGLSGPVLICPPPKEITNETDAADRQRTDPMLADTQTKRDAIIDGEQKELF